jgi:SAM-dependent methyltransferase
MPSKAYVHGYSRREAERLADQASTLVELIHQGTAYPAGARVLEAGCGIGAQTVSLAANSPGARFTSVDISEASLAQATAAVAGRGLTNVEFTRADIFDLPLAEASFDHVFVCFLLEHLAEPERALTHLLRVLKPGGTITVVEGDHGSCYFHPETSEAVAAWRCLVDSQARLGGDSLIGRRLYPLLEGAGFGSVQVEPRMVYIDQGKPALVEGFIPPHHHPHGGGRARPGLGVGANGPDGLDQGHRRPAPDRPDRRHLLLYLLQRPSREVVILSRRFAQIVVDTRPGPLYKA